MTTWQALPTNLLVFDFHKTADKITVKGGLYGGEKTNFK